MLWKSRTALLAGWSLGVRGHLSKHWGEATAANSHFDNESTLKLKDIGNTWACKTVSLLWEFGREMWEDHNKHLHG